MKLLLWLWKRFYGEEDVGRRELLQALITGIRRSGAVVYFMPGKDKVHWRTIAIPRLDFFISRWLEDEKERMKIEEMAENLGDLLGKLSNSARKKGEQRVAENMINLLLKAFEEFAQKMIESGVPDPRALHELVALCIESTTRYNVYTPLTFVRSFA